MPDPGHQFLEARSGRCRQRPAGAPKIMKVLSGDSGFLGCGANTLADNLEQTASAAAGCPSGI
jgi:hypothetical protein